MSTCITRTTASTHVTSRAQQLFGIALYHSLVQSWLLNSCRSCTLRVSWTFGCVPDVCKSANAEKSALLQTSRTHPNIYEVQLELFVDYGSLTRLQEAVQHFQGLCHCNNFICDDFRCLLDFKHIKLNHLMTKRTKLHVKLPSEDSD